MIKPPRLYNVIDIDTFIALEELTVNTYGNGYNKCPCCKNTTLKAYADPAESAIWFYCYQCKFYGDVIDFVTKKINQNLISATYQDAFKYLKDNDALTHYDASDVREYGDYLQDRTTVMDLVTRAAKKLRTDADDRAMEILVKCGGYTGTLESVWSVQMRDSLGFVTQEELSEVSPAFGRATDRYIMMPMYDLPGRLCGAVLVSKKPEPRLLSFYADRRLGLGMLETAPIRSRNIAVTRDHVQAVTLMSEWVMSGTPRPVPLIYWPETVEPRAIWQAVEADNIVFVCDMDMSVVSQACKAQNAKISDMSDIEGSENYDAAYFLSLAMTGAEPALHKIKNMLLKGEDELADRIIEEYYGDTSFVAALHGACQSKVEHDAITQILMGDNALPSTLRMRMTDGNFMVSASDGYWIHIPESDEKIQITNFTITGIQKVLLPKQDMLYADVNIDRKSYGVKVPWKSDTLLKNIQEQLKSSMVPTPECYVRKYAKKLIPIVSDMHPLSTAPGFVRTGWDSRYNHYSFPRFCLSEKGVSHTEYIFPEDSDKYPGYAMSMPSDPSNLTVDVPVAGWTLFAALLGNFIDHRFDNSTINILCSVDGDAAHMRKIATSLNLLTYVFTHTQDYKNNAHHDNSMPVFLDLTNYKPSKRVPLRLVPETLADCPYALMVMPADGLPEDDISIFVHINAESLVDISLVQIECLIDIMLHGLMMETTRGPNVLVTGFNQMKAFFVHNSLKVPDSFTAAFSTAKYIG